MLLVGEVPGQPLDAWVEGYSQTCREERDRIIAAVSGFCRRFWELGFEYRSLYPKHLFLDHHTSPLAVAAIDLE